MLFLCTKGEIMKKELQIKKLLEQIGRPYEMFNDDGTYQGCFYPLQFLYPELPKYNLPENENQFEFGMQKIKEHCKPVHLANLETGDIIALNFKGVLHIAIYFEYGKIIHVFKNHTLEIGRLKMFKNFQSFRVI